MASEHKEIRGEALRTHKTKVHRMLGGHVEGGKADEASDMQMIRKAVRQHEMHDHKGETRTKLKFKRGGGVEGDCEDKPPAGLKLDRPGRARGGKSPHKGASHVNVIVAPQSHPGNQQGPQPATAAPPPPPPHPPMPPPPGGMPPGAGGMPPGGPPMGPSPGGMPGGPAAMPHPPMPPGMPPRKRGGKVGRADGGAADYGPIGEDLRDPTYRRPMPAPPPTPKKSGGPVSGEGKVSYPIGTGAKGGLGRLAKAKAYGEKEGDAED